MVELYWISQALGSIQTSQKQIKENQELILERLEEFKAKLEELGKRVDEQVLVDFRAGMSHLLAGYNSDVDDVRTEEFRMARSIFGKLMSLNPAERTAGTSGEIENTYLICMGYWGSYQYFNMRGDHRNALLNAYECVSKYPGIALLELDLFSSDLFSKDYARLTREASARLGELTEYLDESTRAKLLFYTKQGLRVAAAGAAAAGAAAVSGLFTGGTLSAAAAAAAFHGVYKSIEVRKPEEMDAEEIKGEVERLQTLLGSLEVELVEECEARRGELQRTTLQDLKGLVLL